MGKYQTNEKGFSVIEVVLVIGVVALIAVAGYMVYKGHHKTKTTTTPSVAITASATTTGTQKATVTKTQPTEAVPSYKLIGSFGQGGKAYAISPSDATDEKLILIGKDLNKKFGSDNSATIGIYTDPAQAQIIVDNPLEPANLQGSAAYAYNNAHVAQFNVNKSTNTKQFVIYLHGTQKDVSL